MDYIFLHIEYLIRHHDCVIVPGLGAFLATDIPAHVDLENGKVQPGFRHVSFNRAVTVDDGLLTNSCSRKEGISFDDARQIITKSVADINAKIRSGVNVRCGRLGSFMCGDDDTLVFTPSLATSDCMAVSGYDTVKMVFPEESNETDATDVDKDIDDKKSDEVGIDLDYNKYYHFRINKTLVKVVASLVIIIGVAIGFVMNPIPRDYREKRASVIPIPAVISELEEKPLQSFETSEEIIEQTSESLSQNEAPENTSVVGDSENEEGTNFLIVGTFSSAEEAQNYIKNFSTEEYPLILVSSRKLSRVSVFSSSDYEEVRKKLNSSEISSRFPGAWIWKK